MDCSGGFGWGFSFKKSEEIFGNLKIGVRIPRLSSKSQREMGRLEILSIRIQ